MTSSPRDAIATTPGAFFLSTASRSTKSIEFPGFVPLPAASVRIAIPASAAAASKPRRTAPRTAFILFIPAPLRCVQLLAHDDHQLLISPASAPQQPQQVYRVSGSSPLIDRYFSPSPWVHFQ